MLKKAFWLFISGLSLPVFIIVFLLFKPITNSQVLGAYDEASFVINKIDTEKKIIAMTFDDGPSLATQDILTILKQHQVKATFFFVGNKVDKFPEIIRAIITPILTLGNLNLCHKTKLAKKF